MSDLHVDRVGPEGAPDVVLVHGWAMHGGLWGGLIDVLARNHRVHVPDLPGHGLSTGSEPPADINAWAEVLLRHAPERAAWIGWSLGGLIAQAVARLAPERVTALGLIASTPSFVVRADWPDAVEPAQLAAFADALAEDADRTLSRFLSLQVRGAANATATLRALRTALSSRPSAAPAARQDGLTLLLESDLRGDLDRIAVPIAAVFGGRDTLIPGEAARALQSLAPKARVNVLENAGHAPFWSHSRAVCERLDRWLADAI